MPSGDPDGDGLTNAEEFARGSNPRGTAARYLAEGRGHLLRYPLRHRQPEPAPATIALRLTLDGGGMEQPSIWIEPGRRHHRRFPGA